MTETHALEPRYPTLVRRDVSTSLDFLFFVVVGGFLSLLPGPEETVHDLRSGALIVLWFLYEPIAVWRGATIGQGLTGIRVRRQADPRRRISIVQSFVRFLLKYSLGLVSVIVILFDKRDRAIHDLAVRSIVIRVRPAVDQGH